MSLLRSQQLIREVEERPNLCDLRDDVLTDLISQSICCCQFVIHFLRECFELFKVDREVRAEVKSSLNWEKDLLELVKLFLVLISRSLLTLPVNPVNGLLQVLHQDNTLRFLDVLLHWAVAVNVVLNIVGE